MDEMIYYNALYDCYKDFLTEKQQNYFESYYFYNLSFGEIGENESVSRNAVHKQVKEVTNKLKEMEEKLHHLEIKQKLEQLIEEEKSKEIKQNYQSLLDIL